MLSQKLLRRLDVDLFEVGDREESSEEMLDPAHPFRPFDHCDVILGSVLHAPCPVGFRVGSVVIVILGDFRAGEGVHWLWFWFFRSNGDLFFSEHSRNDIFRKTGFMDNLSKFLRCDFVINYLNVRYGYL